MTGSEMTPMATTLAPTTPVDAASRAPTRIVEMAIPPLTSPNRKPIDSSRRSARLDFCSTMPMKMNSGIAIRIVLFMIDQMRCGISAKIDGPSDSRPKNTATPPKVNATGKPTSSNRSATANMTSPIMAALPAAPGRRPERATLHAIPGTGDAGTSQDLLFRVALRGLYETAEYIDVANHEAGRRDDQKDE